MNRYGSIYIVTNTATGEQYVGQTRQKAQRRWKCHVNTANSKAAVKHKLANAILDYGVSAFDFREVFLAFSAAALNDAEVALIAELSPAYNIAKGGAGHRGVAVSPEIRRGRSERLKRQWADPVWRMQQTEKVKQASANPEASARGRAVAKIGNAARWAEHVKKQKPPPRVKQCKPKRDPLVSRMLIAVSKWKPVYCPELQCSFLSQKAAAEHLGVTRSGVTEAIKRKGKVKRMFTLMQVA
jgi:group I intron endonuclease